MRAQVDGTEMRKAGNGTLRRRRLALPSDELTFSTAFSRHGPASGSLRASGRSIAQPIAIVSEMLTAL